MLGTYHEKYTYIDIMEMSPWECDLYLAKMIKRKRDEKESMK